MAVDWKVDSSRNAEYLFHPQDIVIKAELNGRHELPDIEGLIEDIVKNGQLQACIVRNDGGRPVLIAGFSRWRAIVEINKRKLAESPLKVRASYFRGNERDGFMVNLAENLHRNQTTPLDDAHNCAQLEKWGISTKEIAERLRQKESWVRSRLALVNLAPEAQAALKEGRIKPTAAAAIAKLADSEQRKAVNGHGKVKAASIAAATGKIARPSIKTVREFVQTTADDTTESKAVREFAGRVLKILGVAQL